MIATMKSTNNEEWLDVIDKDDNVIRRATRRECHNDYSLIHRVVHFLVFSPEKGSFLVDRRPLDAESDPGKLAIFGEHVMAGESYSDALVRGVEEELGLTNGKYSSKYISTSLLMDRERFRSGSEIAKLYLVFLNEIPIQEITKRSLVWITPGDLFNNQVDLPPMSRYWLENVDIKSYLPQ